MPKRKKLFFYLLLILFFSSSFGNLWDLYKIEISKDPSYLSALQDLKQVELPLKRYEKFLTPYLELVVGSGVNILKITDEGIGSFTVSFNLNFLKVYGNSIGISFPIEIDPKNRNVDFKYPSLSVSRKLFQEQRAEYLEALADYYNSLWSLQIIEWNKLREIVKNQFDWWYYSKLRELNIQKLEILKEKMSLTVDEEEKENFKKQILQLQKLLLNYEDSLKNIDTECSYELYEDILKSLNDLISKAPKSLKAKREDLIALQYRKESATEKAKLWYLPYIPNPSLGFSIGYDSNEINWELSVSLNYTLFDYGERKLQSESRKVNPKIRNLELETKQKEISRNISNLMNSLESLSIEKELKLMELEDSKKQLDRNKELLEKGFITEPDFELSRIEYELLTVEVQNLEHDILLKKLDFLVERGYDLDFGGVFN